MRNLLERALEQDRRERRRARAHRDDPGEDLAVIAEPNCVVFADRDDVERCEADGVTALVIESAWLASDHVVDVQEVA